MIADLTFPCAGVLTGDLVGSRQHGENDVSRTMQVLERAARDIGADLGVDKIFQRYRGDGWQVFLPEAEGSLRAALRLHAATAAAEALPSRIAIGFGPATLPGTRDLAAASGDAFTMAGDVLADMPRDLRLALPNMLSSTMHALLLFVDRESQGWNRTQGEAIFEALRVDQPTQEQIADKTGVSRQAIQSRLSGTALNALREGIAAYENTLSDLCAQMQREPLASQESKTECLR